MNERKNKLLAAGTMAPSSSVVTLGSSIRLDSSASVRRTPEAHPTRAVRLSLVALESSRHELNEPIGIEMVAASAVQTVGVNVRVNQYFVPVNGLPARAQLEQMDILGISMPLGSLRVARRLYDVWKSLREDQRPVLVLGGLVPTFATEELLRKFPLAILVIGEGEESIQGIVSAVARGRGNEGVVRQRLVDEPVPNLALLLGGQMVTTPRRNIKMGQAPTPRRDFVREIAQRGGILRSEASRGCSWGRCTFCAIQHKYCGEARWRDIPIEHVVKDLAELSDAGVKHPYYTDEDFMGNDSGRAVKLAEAILDAKRSGRIAADMTMYLDMRVASILDPGKRGKPSGKNALIALREAGLREVFLGVESGSKEQVRRYKKPATATRNLRALDLLRELSISVDIGFIFFDPEMSLEEAKANLDFLRESGLWTHDARMTKEVRVEAGTPLVAQYRSKNMLTGPMDIDELTYPYRWLDSRVHDLHHVFRLWEDEAQERVYELQSSTRGEVVTEQLRRVRRRRLGLVRGVEHDALAGLIDHVLEGNKPDSMDFSSFSKRRQSLLDAALDSPSVPLVRDSAKQ